MTTTSPSPARYLTSQLRQDTTWIGPARQRQAKLNAEITQINAAIASTETRIKQIEQIIGKEHGTVRKGTATRTKARPVAATHRTAGGTTKSTAHAKGARKPMSAKGRRSIALAQKRRWAKVRADKKAHASKPKARAAGA